MAAFNPDGSFAEFDRVAPTVAPASSRLCEPDRENEPAGSRRYSPCPANEQSGFKDHFSASSASYAAYRPHYPEALFDWLAGQVEGHDLAWDCATGNGQAAAGLARHFARVVASDASTEQIARAEPISNVEYRVAAAEASGLGDASADLVTVAQAAHWFDLPRFYAEVRRVLRPGGCVALWGYERLVAEPAVAEVIGGFYADELAGFWPPERRLVETAYRDLPFPFAEAQTPAFGMSVEWDMEQLLGYIGSWSAVRNYRRERGVDPLPGLRARLAERWGSPQARKAIKWPLFLRLGRV